MAADCCKKLRRWMRAIVQEHPWKGVVVGWVELCETHQLLLVPCGGCETSEPRGRPPRPMVGLAGLDHPTSVDERSGASRYARPSIAYQRYCGRQHYDCGGGLRHVGAEIEIETGERATR